MNKIKIAAMFLILSGGVLVAYFTVKNSVPAAGVIQTENGTDIKRITNGNLLDWLNNSADKNIGTADQSADNLSQSNFSQFDNLTDLVAQSMFNGMKIMDQNGTNPFEKINTNDLETQKLIQDTINNLPQFAFETEVNEKDIKISKDNSKDNKIEYLRRTGEAIFKNSNDVYKDPTKTISGVVDSGSTSDARKLSDTYKTIFDQFMDITVPSDFINLHKNYLTILKSSEAIYGGISNFQNDPVKANLFIKLIPDLVKKETEIKQQYYKKSLEINS